MDTVRSEEGRKISSREGKVGRICRFVCQVGNLSMCKMSGPSGDDDVKGKTN
jgi:hypothetical protein